ncbi:MAG: hypothetical protein EOP49_07115, partial [Sphingobacteriales bacterium]
MNQTLRFWPRLFLLATLCAPFVPNAQNIFSGEPVQWVGTPNGFGTTPYNSDYRTLSYRKISTTATNPADGRGQWTTSINVQNSGGNISPANLPGGAGGGFLLISGPSNNRFQNKWNFEQAGQAGLNSVNSVLKQDGGQDMGLNMSTPGYYTFNFRDAGYVNSDYFVGYTASAPVSVSRLGQSFVNGTSRISIGTGSTPSATENVYVRYRASFNDFTSATAIAQATGSGTSWTATIPGQGCGATVYYYVFTSTRTLAQLNADSEANRSLAALRYDDASGANYSYTTTSAGETAFTGGGSICEGSSANLVVSITGSVGPFTIYYTDGSSNFVVSNYVSGTAIPVTPLATTTYTLSDVQSANGCELILNGQSQTVTVIPAQQWFVDADNDGYGNGAVPTISACVQPVNTSTVAGDCDDSDASKWRSGLFYTDADADGYTTTATAVSVCYGTNVPAGNVAASLGVDCNDADAAKWQSGVLFVDADADGYDNGSATVCYGTTVPAGYAATTLGSDCNDNNAAVHT